MLFLADFPQVLANRNEVLVVVPFAGVGDCPFKLLKDLLRCCAGARQKQSVEIIQAHYRRLCRGMLLRQFQGKLNRLECLVELVCCIVGGGKVVKIRNARIWEKRRCGAKLPLQFQP